MLKSIYPLFSMVIAPMLKRPQDKFEQPLEIDTSQQDV